MSLYLPCKFIVALPTVSICVSLCYQADSITTTWLLGILIPVLPSTWLRVLTVQDDQTAADLAATYSSQIQGGSSQVTDLKLNSVVYSTGDYGVATYNY
ncbi:hypothetical protein F4821DRAFT_247249 [Hypoxylon rubiginosum]|uniref:Uncharacterized protein n=1 Tax=Hypoxylon rubiginosum TaxID=110542 RepID=A0ACC0CPJ9_9PEZI|nr:hypothetical protein F4821DRAFT_247249 [Hypoxylon rubiginosum]